MEIIEIIFGLAFTAGVYCIIPLAVAVLCKTSIAKKKYAIICVIGEAAIAVVFQLLRYGFEVSGSSFTPAVIWGVIFYNVGISVLRKRHRLSDSTPPKREIQAPAQQSDTLDDAEQSAGSVEPVAASPELTAHPAAPSVTDTWYTCPACGCLNRSGAPCDCGYDPRPSAPAPNRRKHKVSALSIVLSAALVISLIVNIVQYTDLSECQTELAAAEQSNKTYSASVSDLTKKVKSQQEELETLSLYKSNACVVAVGSRTYHRDPTCAERDTSVNYWIFNTEAAESQGYRACVTCSPKVPVFRFVETPVLTTKS